MHMPSFNQEKVQKPSKHIQEFINFSPVGSRKPEDLKPSAFLKFEDLCKQFRLPLPSVNVLLDVCPAGTPCIFTRILLFRLA